MISNVSIKNYKSVVDVSLPLGRFNLLIGANGCGKSNILEGIALGAAASADKLDYEYFANRGIRVTDSVFMLPAFENVNADKIHVSVSNEEGIDSIFDIHYNSEAKPARWEDDSVSFSQVASYIKKDGIKAQELIKMLDGAIPGFTNDTNLNIRVKRIGEQLYVIPSTPELYSFLIYSIEESKLRKADDSNRTFPLGLHGEGLFAYLKNLSQQPYSTELIDEIKDNLKILDWFGDMQIPSNQLSNEFSIKLKDSYMSETLNMFDQRSTNEGFLYLLFYLTLVISDETPQFFAIENIDTAFNPKLCREVVRRLIELARKHDKQIIATTHNPAVLDGLDLHDEEQKLMVVQRSVDGYTKVRTLNNKDIVKSDLPLSQLWLRGFIGGLPNNF
ncbi:MAG: AAA family ATPase [Prevotella sp.]|nr:AAA family ATPase [Prevotella sp.]